MRAPQPGTVAGGTSKERRPMKHITAATKLDKAKVAISNAISSNRLTAADKKALSESAIDLHELSKQHRQAAAKALDGGESEPH
jgi:hypothetical protein